MNASVHLLHLATESVVGIRSEIPSEHASAGILGTERMGSGVLIAPAGVVLTAHYLAVGADRVEIEMTGGEKIPARVAGIDYDSGLAALAPLGVRLGGLARGRPGPETIGRDAFIVAALEGTRRVASGVVTSRAAFEAFWEYMIDDALTLSVPSPGLGGGPIVDTHGRVIGVVALSMAEVGRFTLGIPATLADRLLAGVEADGSFENPSPSGWIGLLSYPVGEELVVASAMPGSPADRSGIVEGDRIESIEGQPTRSRRALYLGLRATPPGSKLRLGIRRGSESISVQVVTSAIERYFAT